MPTMLYRILSNRISLSSGRDSLKHGLTINSVHNYYVGSSSFFFKNNNNNVLLKRGTASCVSTTSNILKPLYVTKSSLHFHHYHLHSFALLHRHSSKGSSVTGIPVHFFATSSNQQPPNGPPKGPYTGIFNKSRLSGLGAVSSIAFLSLTKTKSILAALKLTKFASLGSMLLTVGAYTTLYGLPYATGMVGLILVHESGHALMMRHKKIPFSPMIFVPFMGAAIAAKRPAKNAYEDALVALAGPVLGSAGAGVVWGAGMMTDSQLCLALADFGFMVNLFNLIPVGMLDGGRIGNALSPYTGLVGVGIAGSMIYSGMVSNPIFYIITLAGGYQSGMRLWNHHKGIVDTSLPPNFYRISQREKMIISGGYFGLMGALFTAMAINSDYKKTPEQIRFQQRAMAGKMVEGNGLINQHYD